nr:uncharacterized protein LOC121117593 [Lepeophtheirus salmonis]
MNLPQKAFSRKNARAEALGNYWGNQLKQSSPQSLLLDRVSLKGQGTFSCEVSSLPSFDTRQGSAQVVVGRLPMSIPEIDSSNLASKKLKEGDVTSFNCSSFGSIPPPNITWFINGNRASENPLSSSKIFLNQSHHIPYGWDTKSQLTLPIESQLLTPNASRIKIKCLVTLYDLYYKSHEITLEILREMKERDSSHRRARPKKTVTRTEPILDVYAHSPGIGSGGVYSWGFMTSSLMYSCFLLLGLT